MFNRFCTLEKYGTLQYTLFSIVLVLGIGAVILTDGAWYPPPPATCWLLLVAMIGWLAAEWNIKGAFPWRVIALTLAVSIGVQLLGYAGFTFDTAEKSGLVIAATVALLFLMFAGQLAAASLGARAIRPR